MSSTTERGLRKGTCLIAAGRPAALLYHPGDMVEKLKPRQRYLSPTKREIRTTEIGLTNADFEMIMIGL
jgi:hypothetical protein